MLFFEVYKTGLEPIVLVRSSLSEENKVEVLQEIADYLDPEGLRIAVVVDSSEESNNAILFLDNRGFLSFVRAEESLGNLEASVLCKVETKKGPKIVITKGNICKDSIFEGHKVSIIASKNTPRRKEAVIKGYFEVDKVFPKEVIKGETKFHPMMRKAISFVIDVRRFELTQHVSMFDDSFCLNTGFFIDNVLGNSLALTLHDCVGPQEFGSVVGVAKYFSLVLGRFDVEDTFLEKTLEIVNADNTSKMLDIFLFGLQYDIDIFRFIPRALRPVTTMSEHPLINYVALAAREITNVMCRKEPYSVESYLCIKSIEDSLKDSLVDSDVKRDWLKKAQELKRAFFIFDTGRRGAKDAFLKLFSLMFARVRKHFALHDIYEPARAMKDQFEVLNVRFEASIQKTLKLIKRLHVFNRELHLFHTLSPKRLGIENLLGLVEPEDVLSLTLSFVGLFEDAILMFCIQPPSFVYQDHEEHLEQVVQELREVSVKREKQVRSQFKDIRRKVKGM